MKLFGMFALTCVVWLSLFGVSSVHAGMQDHAGRCIAAITQGSECPKDSSVLGYLTFHMETVRGFMSAIFSSDVPYSSLGLSVFAFLLLLFSFKKSSQTSDRFVAYRVRAVGDHSLFFSKEKFVKWLVLHENSPNIPHQAERYTSFSL